MKIDENFMTLVNDIRVNNAVVIIGAGVSFEPGMPLGSQLAPIVWEVVSCFPEIDQQFKGKGSTKSRIGEDFGRLKKAFAYIEKSEEALDLFKSKFKKINDKITITPNIHKNIAKLIHENFLELIVSFNWDSLLELSWSELYGTNINDNKINMLKPHGDTLDLENQWVLPNSPGRISHYEKDYINLLAKERPRTLIIVGYSENDAKIVEELITPFENRWKVYRVSPFSLNEDVIQHSAEDFFERLVQELIHTKLSESWDYLNFKNQNPNLARAILGYKLTPQDVNICPELPQVKKAIKILDLNNFVILQGKPGSGKSISSYQIAYHYLKQGYEVLRFKTENFVGEDDFHIPFNSKAIYILDDGQVLPNSLLLGLQEKSSANQKIILTVTDDIDVDSAIISISNIENIECISNYYKKNQVIVTNIISSIDGDVGNYFMQESLEYRIKAASKEENLWTFNYILRGGWKTTKENYFQSKELDNSQRLIFLISLKQIITKDNVVDSKWVTQKVNEYFSKDEEWVQRSLKKLRKKRLIDSTNLRMIHYEAAKRQLAFIFENDNENRIKYEKIIRDEIMANNNPLLGKVWFMNAIFSSRIKNRIPFIISADEFYNIIEENLWTDEQILIDHTFYFIDVLTRSLDSQYFDIYHFSSLILDQIENVNNSKAYSLSRVINNVYNVDRDKAKKLGTRLNIEKIANRVSNLKIDDLYHWSQFISRLHLLLSKEKAMEFIELINKSEIEKELLLLQYTQLDFDSLVDFIVNIFIYDRAFGANIFHLTSKNFQVAFKHNSINAWHTLGFNFLAIVMGFNSLNDKRDYIKKDQRMIGEKIISFIDSKQLAEELVTVSFRNWHNMSSLYHILRKVDSNKYSELVESIDLVRLETKFDENHVWRMFHSEITEFLFLYLDKKYIQIIDKFLYNNKEKLMEKNFYQFAFSPTLIRYYIDKNLYIPLYRDNYSKDRLDWHALEIVIFLLLGKDDNLLRSFLLIKSTEIADAISSFEELHLVSINHILQEVANFDQEIFIKIKGKINHGILNDKAKNSLNSRLYSEKHLLETKQKLILLFQQLNITNTDFL